MENYTERMAEPAEQLAKIRVNLDEFYDYFDVTIGNKERSSILKGNWDTSLSSGTTNHSLNGNDNARGPAITSGDDVDAGIMARLGQGADWKTLLPSERQTVLRFLLSRLKDPTTLDMRKDAASKLLYICQGLTQCYS